MAAASGLKNTSQRRRLLRAILPFVGAACLIFLCIRIQRTRGRDPTATENDTPLPIIYMPWKPVIEETEKISASCPEFIFYSISVQSKRAERHHFRSVASPNVTTPECAVLLVLRTNSINRSSFDVVTEFQRSEDQYSILGWEVLATSHELPAILARRISRLPKLNPAEIGS